MCVAKVSFFILPAEKDELFFCILEFFVYLPQKS